MRPQNLIENPFIPFSFNGMEKDNDLKGHGNSYTTEFRQYDPRLGRWLTVDPKATAWESPYVGMSNNPIIYNDPLGDSIKITGLAAQQTAFLKKLNAEVGKEIFIINVKGYLQFKDPNQNVTNDPFLKMMDVAMNADVINDKEIGLNNITHTTITLHMVPNRDNNSVDGNGVQNSVFFDQWDSGEVDVNDMSIVSGDFYKSVLIHFIYERIGTAGGYDAKLKQSKLGNNDKGLSVTDFEPAHNIGHLAQLKFLKDLYSDVSNLKEWLVKPVESEEYNSTSTVDFGGAVQTFQRSSKDYYTPESTGNKVESKARF
jgi:RHS repeat-associated protein